MLKDYDVKHTQLLASHLNPPAFDVYRGLSDAEKSRPAVITKELLKEFEKVEVNRDEALYKLNNHTLLYSESVDTFAYKILDLVKLAYRDFADTVRATIAREYFVKALSPEMQITLKSIPDFAGKTIQQLVTKMT